jgi:hypothetical protein
MGIKKKVILISISLVLIGILGYLGKGASEYFAWINAKEAVALSGFPWQCGAFQVLAVQPACTETPLGCTCMLCEAMCDESTQVTFAGQANCLATFACISPEVIPKGGPILTSRQMILAGMSNLITGNGIVGTQSVAASRIEKIISFFDRYIIAGFKDK